MGRVDVLAMHFQVAEIGTADVAQLFVVIARYVNHLRAVLGLAQDRAQYVVVDLRPVEAAPEAPDIDDIAHQEQLFHLHVAQEVQHQVGTAFAGAQVDVGDEGAADVDDRARGATHSQDPVLPSLALGSRVRLRDDSQMAAVLRLDD